MNDLPKITIVTVVRNAAATIEKAIQSVMAQDYPNLEYIVLDGASDDGTVDIIKKYDKHISYWRSEADNGAADGYAEAVDIAAGDVIGYLNADDFYENDVLLRVGEVFGKNPDADIVSFRYRVLEIGENGEYNVLSECPIFDTELDKDKDCSCLGINAKFFKKNLFLKYGAPLKYIGDDENRTFISNDIELLIRLVLRGVKNVSVDYVGYNYLSHKDSKSFADNAENNIIYMEDRIFIANRFLNDADITLNKIWQRKFKKWIKKYRAKLVKANMKSGNFLKAKQHLYLGIHENGATSFLYYLVKTLLRRK